MPGTVSEDLLSWKKSYWLGCCKAHRNGCCDCRFCRVYDFSWSQNKRIFWNNESL